MATISTAPILALTVKPPWSHWLASGAKPVENRTWAPPAGWRGLLVIHAGRTIDPAGLAVGARLGHPVDEDELNIGEFIAVGQLADVHPAGPDCWASCAGWGVPGCLHWMLTGVRRLVTVEGRGRQRLFVPPDDVIEQVTSLGQ